MSQPPSVPSPLHLVASLMPNRVLAMTHVALSHGQPGSGNPWVTLSHCVMRARNKCSSSKPWGDNNPMEMSPSYTRGAPFGIGSPSFPILSSPIFHSCSMGSLSKPKFLPTSLYLRSCFLGLSWATPVTVHFGDIVESKRRKLVINYPGTIGTRLKGTRLIGTYD